MDEAEPLPQNDISIDPYADPYASTLPTGTDSSFGTAFTDDTDATPQEPSFDIYSAPIAPPSFGAPPTEESPSVNFSTLGRIDPTILSPRSQMNRAPSVDYVFAEDYKDVRKKSGTDQLTYLAGTGYLLGAGLGGTAGAFTALKSSAGKPTKLKINALLNGAGKTGARMANTFGVLALVFSLSESALYNYTNDETLANYAAAGAAAGALFKSTRGVRVAGVWGLGGMALSVGAIWASRQGYYGRGLQGVL